MHAHLWWPPLSPPSWAQEPKSGMSRLGPPVTPARPAATASAHSCGEKWHYSDTMIGNTISVASEDDKRPETPSRDRWTKGNGDFDLLRCENNTARVHGPV